MSVLVPLLLSAAIAQVSVSPVVPPRDTSPRPTTGTAAISGRVTAADTGLPIRNASVTLGGPRPRVTQTDADGRYSFTAIPAGNYTLSANAGPTRATYVTSGYGAAGPSGASRIGRPTPITLKEAERRTDIDIALYRAAVITGRVTDASGEPAARVQVRALLVRPGMPPMNTGGGQMTNDLGEYRIFGLMPGDYIVAAETRNFSSYGEPEGDVSGFTLTYAPGTAAVEQAVRLRLRSGAEASADLQLIETRLFSVSGMVLTSKGEPTRDVSVMVSRADQTSGGMSYGANITPAGTFTVRNLPPGSYEFVARPASMGPPPREGVQELALARVEVAAADVEGIVLAMRPGDTVVGEIVYEDGITEGRRPSINALTTERRTFAPSPASEVQGSTFTLRNLFGPVVIRGSVAGQGGTWGVKGVLLNGKDITDEPTRLTAADSGRLQVVFTHSAPAIEGTVTDDAGKPVTASTIILFAEDDESWRPMSSMLRVTTQTKDGVFRFRGLRVGRYRIAALPPEFMFSASTPDLEFLRSLKPVATEVVLNAGDNRTVDLRLIRFEQ